MTAVSGRSVPGAFVQMCPPLGDVLVEDCGQGEPFEKDSAIQSRLEVLWLARVL